MVKFRTLFPIHLNQIICIGFLWMLLTCFTGIAYAIDQTFSYLSVFSGSQDLSASPGGLAHLERQKDPDCPKTPKDRKRFDQWHKQFL